MYACVPLITCTYPSVWRTRVLLTSGSRARTVMRSALLQCCVVLLNEIRVYIKVCASCRPALALSRRLNINLVFCVYTYVLVYSRRDRVKLLGSARPAQLSNLLSIHLMSASVYETTQMAVKSSLEESK